MKKWTLLTGVLALTLSQTTLSAGTHALLGSGSSPTSLSLHVGQTPFQGEQTPCVSIIGASRWRLQKVLTSKIQSTLTNGFCARGVRNDSGAGQLRFEVGIGYSTQVVEEEGKVVAIPKTVLRGAFEKSLVEIALGLSGGGSRFVEAGHHAEDGLLKCKLLMLALQQPANRSVEVVKGLDQSRIPV